jgi:hypothetical protein
MPNWWASSHSWQAPFFFQTFLGPLLFKLCDLPEPISNSDLTRIPVKPFQTPPLSTEFAILYLSSSSQASIRQSLTEHFANEILWDARSDISLKSRHIPVSLLHPLFMHGLPFSHPVFVIKAYYFLLLRWCRLTNQRNSWHWHSALCFVLVCHQQDLILTFMKILRELQGRM